METYVTVYKIWTQNSQLFWKNVRKCQRTFRLMVDILNIGLCGVNWVVALIWHNFVKVAGNWTKICSPA